MKTIIYALRENGFVRYVGKTKFSLKDRLAGHLQDARKGVKTYKCNWIRSVLEQGLAPTITVLEVSEGDGSKEEIAWIKYFRDHGIELTNGTEGGDGVVMTPEVREKHLSKMRSAEHRELVSRLQKGHITTLETRKKISSSNKGKVRSVETRAKLSEAHKGYIPTVKARLAMSKAAKGKRKSLEVRINMSIAARRKGSDPEFRAKISKALTGRILSPTHVKNMSLASKGRIMPLDVRKKISASTKGIPKSPETIRNMTLAQKLLATKRRGSKI